MPYPNLTASMIVIPQTSGSSLANGQFPFIERQITGSNLFLVTDRTGTLIGTSNLTASNISASGIISASNLLVTQNVGVGSSVTVGTTLTVGGLVTVNNNLSASGVISASSIWVGSSGIYGNLTGTASWANNAVNANSASWATNVNSASWATNVNSASWANNALSSSWATNVNTASWANNATNAISSQTASFLVPTNNYTVSTLNSTTLSSSLLVLNTAARIVDNMVSGSTLPISASLYVAATATTQSNYAAYISSTVLTGSAYGLVIDVTSSSSSQPIAISASGDVIARSFTGSLFGTSSWASNVNSSSWSNNALSSSWATNVNTASWATTSSWANNVNTASWATNAVNANSSSWATNVNSASWATNVNTASWANNAVNANSASWATNVNSASWATNVNSASWSTNALSASWATNVNTASWSNNATSAQTSSFLVPTNNYTVSTLNSTTLSSSFIFSNNAVRIVENISSGSVVGATSASLYVAATATTQSNVAVTIDSTVLTGSAYGLVINVNASSSGQSIAISASGDIIARSFTGSFSGSVAGSITNADSASITNLPTDTGTYFVTFVGGTSGYRPLYVDNATLTWVPSTNTLSSSGKFISSEVTASGGINTSVINSLDTVYLYASSSQVNIGQSTGLTRFNGDIQVGPNGLIKGSNGGSGLSVFSTGIQVHGNAISGSDGNAYLTFNTTTPGVNVSSTAVASAAAGGSGALTVQGGAFIRKNLIVSGSTELYGDLTIYGTSSIVNISSSTVIIGDNRIQLNSFGAGGTPQRYAGLDLVDSASLNNNVTSSFLWDGLNNYWLLTSNQTGSSPLVTSSAIILQGPTSSFGSENLLTIGTFLKVQTDVGNMISSSLSETGNGLEYKGTISASAITASRGYFRNSVYSDTGSFNILTIVTGSAPNDGFIPASPTAFGLPGQIEADNNFIYIYTNQIWKRVPVSVWSA
jgi:fibronectin-binding autotransporter adhesin